MDAIRQWLNGKRNYSDGVALYKEHGRDKKLIALFTLEAVSDFKKQKLAHALIDLLSGIKEQQQQEFVRKTDYFTHHRGWPPEVSSDEVLRALYGQWKPLYSEMCNLQARLHDVALAGNSDANRRLEASKMTHRILHLDDQCQDIYGKRQHYLQHGKLPEHRPPDDMVGDPMKLAINLKNFERYIRDYQLKLKKDPNNEKWAQKLKTYQTQLAWTRKQLGLDEQGG